jgi:hypothetical protein
MKASPMIYKLKAAAILKIVSFRTWWLKRRVAMANRERVRCLLATLKLQSKVQRLKLNVDARFPDNA